jgi:hypothetical protein
MRQKSSGVAVLAIVIGVAVFAVTYIASFGRSGHHAEITPHQNEAVAENTASDARFTLAPLHAASSPEAETAAR